MHLEIQVALNFLISFLYNKLPRRRVNQFGEELETALKVKFSAHWYPAQPAKGSAYRCVKTTNPLDPVFELAARNCGLQLSDIQSYLPAELCIWIDPGEVSYRMSEKGPVKLLYQETPNSNIPIAAQQIQQQQQQQQLQQQQQAQQQQQVQRESLDMHLSSMLLSNNNNSIRDNLTSPFLDSNLEQLLNDSNSSTDLIDECSFLEPNTRKVRSFNPEAQCFKPDSLSMQFPLSSTMTSPSNNNTFNNTGLTGNSNNNLSANNLNLNNNTGAGTYNGYAFSASSAAKPSMLNAGFTAAKSNQVTMTTAQFAQTKFGSTKLKSSGNNSCSNGSMICGINGSGSKRNYSNRMSPTEFSAYIKQRSLMQNANNSMTDSTSIGGTIASSLPIASNNSFFNPSANNCLGRSLSSSFSNHSTANNSSHLLALSPQPSRSISPLSPISKPLTSSSNLDATLNYMMLNQTTAQPMSNTCDNLFSSMFSDNSNSSVALGNNSALFDPLPGNDNASLSLEMNYLSDLLGTTSLSPSMLNTNESCMNKSKPTPGPIGSRLNQLMLQNQPEADAFGLNNMSLSNASFLGFNEMLDSPSSSLLLSNSLTSNSNNLNTGNNNGGLLVGGLQVDFNNNVIGNDLIESNNNNSNNNCLPHNTSSLLNDSELTKSNNNNNNSGNNSSESQSSNASQTSEDGSLDSFSITLNGVTYPNQYQHLLVAN